MANGTDKIYELVTDRIVTALEEGTVPWKRPWRVEGGIHKNLASKKAYRGVNQFLLDLTAMKEGCSVRRACWISASSRLPCWCRALSPPAFVAFALRLRAMLASPGQ